MAFVFRPTTAADEERLGQFLIRGFAADHDAEFASPLMLRWKYWEPRDDYRAPRSYIIEKDGRIVAHAGLWPVTVRGKASIGHGVSMIDWTSAADAPGAGMAILQRLMRTFDLVYSIGGTEMTTSIMPKVGFLRIAEANTWARPLRPFRQILEHQHKDLRLPARLARNLLWSKLPATTIQPGWTTIEVHAADIEGESALANERSCEFFGFLERCPTVRCLIFQILKGGRKKGCFVLALRRTQARIAGVWLEEPSAENWRITFQLAQEVALRQTLACEIIARSAAEPATAAAAQAGMRLRARTPILLYRKDGEAKSSPIQFQLLDNDGFLGSERSEFLT